MKGRKNSLSLGVYFDVEKIALSVASYSGKLNVSKTIIVPTDYKVESVIKPLSINNDFFNEKQKWVVSLKEIVKKSDFKVSTAIVSLSHDFSMARFFTMPSIERKFWNKSIPLESKKYIPVSFDETSYDYYVERLETNKLGIFFGVTQRKTGEFITKIFKELSIELKSIEPSVITFVRIFNNLVGDENGIFVYFDDDTDVYISVIYKNLPLLFRYISFSRSLSFSDRKSLDLRGAILFAQRIIPNAEINKIVICGNPSDIWIEVIERETQIKPVVMDIGTKMISPTIDFPTVMSSFTSAKHSVTDRIFIDISGIEKTQRIYKKVSNYLFTISAIISAFFIFLFLLNLLRLYILSNKVSQMRVKMNEINELMNMSEEEINKKVSTISQISEILTNILTKRDFFAPKLSDIAEVIPKDFWLVEINYTNPVTVNKEIRDNISITLSGETFLSGENRSYYFDYFKKELKKLKSYRLCNMPGNLTEDVTEPKTENIFGPQGKIKPTLITISCSIDKFAL